MALKLFFLAKAIIFCLFILMPISSSAQSEKTQTYALAKREYYPDFNFKFAYGQRDNSPDMKRRDMLTGMMEINIPIFYKSKQDRKVAETNPAA